MTRTTTALGLSVLICLLLPASPADAELPAFPGAEGWGSTTSGGRGGQVLFVTNLDDSGAGSLRDAVMTEGPRTILFRVSGIIHLESPIFLGGVINQDDGEKYSHLTIAGHSAPGGGVVVADYGITLTNGVHDVVIRHLRVRNAQRDIDGLLSGGDNFDIKGARRVILDHCSASWSTDENVGLEENQYGNEEITIQNCLVAEGLLHGGHETGEHSRGIHVSKGADRVTLHHNLMMSNDFRNPNAVGNADLLFPDRPPHPVFDIRHNLTYNFGAKASHGKKGSRVNWVGNLVIHGPDSRVGRKPFKIIEPDLGTSWYLEGNASPAFPDVEQIGLVEFPPGREPELAAVPWEAPPVTPTPVDRLQEEIAARVGARPLDPTDARLLTELAAGTGSMGAPERDHSSPIPAPAPGEPFPDRDDDGMPDYWEERAGLDPLDALDGPGDHDGDGYSNLEEYLDELAALLLELPFEDDFDDGRVGEAWRLVSGSWQEADDRLSGDAEGAGRAVAVADGAVSGCTVCAIEALVEVHDADVPGAGGVIGWSGGRGTEVAALLLPRSDRLVYYQRSAGSILDLRQVDLELEDGRPYRLALSFDGERFRVELDGERLLEATDAADRMPWGPAGLVTLRTATDFHRVTVERLAGP